MSKEELLEDCLNEPSVGDSKSFQWLATPIGIAALCKEKDADFSDTLLTIAIKEGLTVALDLSKEEFEYHYSSKGLAILFYS